MNKKSSARNIEEFSSQSHSHCIACTILSGLPSCAVLRSGCNVLWREGRRGECKVALNSVRQISQSFVENLSSFDCRVLLLCFTLCYLFNLSLKRCRSAWSVKKQNAETFFQTANQRVITAKHFNCLLRILCESLAVQSNVLREHLKCIEVWFRSFS